VTRREPELHYRLGAIKKYGILDLTYGISSTALPVHRPGIAVLRDVHLVDGGEGDSDTFGSGQDRPT